MLALLTASCEKANPVGPSDLASTNAFLMALQQQGATVARGDMLPRESNPFFSTSAQVVLVNGGHINVFEYPTKAAVERDAATVSPDGSSVGSTMITWVGPPHFYKSGLLIVIYAGSADSVLRPLEAVLGKPFAHR
jgi:hypothetical protein